jgi:hypothetical protein
MSLDRLRQKLPISPYLVELTACLERTYAYAFTGNARMLCSLLKPFDLQQALLEYGLPSLSKLHFSFSDATGKINVDRALWPMKGEFPMLASTRSMQIRYGNEYQYVCHPPPSHSSVNAVDASLHLWQCCIY